jgi:septum formation protein
MTRNDFVVLLCSASPRRRNLIRRLGLPFKTFKPDVDESVFSAALGLGPRVLVMKLAFAKALEGAKNFPGRNMVALGADTIVVLRGKVIGKPKDRKDAARMLGALSGSYHEVYTGVALIDCNTMKCESACEVSRAKMRKLSPAEIAKLSAKHLDKAGAYAVQEKGDAFIEKVEGDYYNVVGFPIKKIRKMLKSFRRANPA